MPDDSVIEPTLPPTVVIRERDYYGGTITFTLPESSWDTEAPALALRWRAWGQYGSATIVLRDENECRTLAAALLKAADTLAGDDD